MKPIINACEKTRICAVEAYDKPVGEAINSSAISLFGEATLFVFDVPKCTNKLFLVVLEKCKSQFKHL